MELRRIALLLAPLLLAAACSMTRGAVAAPEPYAAREGARVLAEGGSAVDAAVCMGFVLAVTHPAAGNLGGGGFLLVHTDRGDVVIDCRETAPRAARADMFLDAEGEPEADASLIGPKAAGVPGSVAGYLRLLEDRGTMDRKRLLEPAIRLAEDGFNVDQGLHDALVESKELLARFPETARIFLPGGEAPPVGHNLRHP